MIGLEIDLIGRHLPRGGRVLDAGCGNGYSARQQWMKRHLGSLTGIDFAENMIRQANASKKKYRLSPKVNFEKADIRRLPFPDNSFDALYTTRVIINLPNWEEQLRAIAECVRVTKKGGKIIFSEAFWEPLVLLNALRALKQLPPLAEHDFNRYIKKQRLEKYLASKRIPYEVDDFSSVYYLGSRFLRELVTDISAYKGYTNPINKIFYEIEQDYSGGGFGIQQAYILRKPLK